MVPRCLCRASPSARPTVPSRQARPTLSLTMTATATRKCSSISRLSVAALASGSRGSRRTCSPSPHSATLDWSTPAFAQLPNQIGAFSDDQVSSVLGLTEEAAYAIMPIGLRRDDDRTAP